MDATQIPPIDATNIAVINTNIIYIQRDIQDIKNALNDAYATKASVLDLSRIVEDLRKDFNRKTNGFSQWGGMIITGIVTAVMTFFIVGYFSNLHR